MPLYLPHSYPAFPIPPLHSAQVLDECARTYRHFLDTDFTLLSTVVGLGGKVDENTTSCLPFFMSSSSSLQEVAFTQLVDELVLAFRQYSQELKDQSLVVALVIQL